MPVKQRVAQGKAALAKKLMGKPPQPVTGVRGKVATTFWGRAWVAHVRSIGDFEGRLDRGRAISGNGSVLHLEISTGTVKAYVAGAEMYEIKIGIQPLKPARWSAIKAACAGNLGSMVELLQGKFSDEVMAHLIAPTSGMFPSANDFDLDCSCPDYVRLCKHLAGVLFAVGAKLDHEPELLFILRGVDAAELLDVSPILATANHDSDVLDDSDLADVFGIDVTPAPKAAAASRSKQLAARTPNSGRSKPKKRSKTNSQPVSRTSKKSGRIQSSKPAL